MYLFLFGYNQVGGSETNYFEICKRDLNGQMRVQKLTGVF